MKVAYAIGDIHGAVNKLERLHAMIVCDIKYNGYDDVEIIFLGDYIDRGPCSKEVLDFCMDMEDSKRIKYTFLRGNHEDMFSEAYNDGNLAMREVFLSNGGRETLESFGHDCVPFGDFMNDVVVKKYADWMDSLPVKHKLGKYVFVHGGYQPLLPYDQQEDEVAMWKRTDYNEFVYHDCEYVIVHGHTYVMYPKVYSREIAIDTGAYMSEHSELTAAVIRIDGDSLDNDVRFITSS